jgi:hypothetical protein
MRSRASSRSCSAPRRLAGGQLSLTIALVIAGCGKDPRVVDCGKLDPVAREQSAKLRTMLNNAAPNPSAMEASAKSLEDGAKALGALELKEATAAHYAAAYRQQLLDGAKLMRDLGAVNPDLTEASASAGVQVRAMDFLLEEGKLLAQLTEYCK